MKKLGFFSQFVASQPQKLYLELTSSCNLDCAMCYRKSWKHQTSDLPPEILAQLILEIASMSGLREIVVGGVGEPTGAEEFLPTARELAAKHLVLTTNGTFLHQDPIAQGVADYFRRVVVSVDGEGETFLKTRGTHLEQIVFGIQAVQQAGGNRPEILLQFVLNTDNADEIFYVIDLAAKLHLQGVILSNVVPATAEWADKIMYHQEPNQAVKELYKRVLNYSFRLGISLTIPNHQLKTERRCRFVDDGATYVNCRGEVVPCYRFAHQSKEFVFGREKIVEPHVFGNLTDNTLQEIWNSSEYQRYRYTIYNNLYPSCLDCDLVDGCEIVSTTTWDCQGNMPTCGDCLWARNYVICP